MGCYINPRTEPKEVWLRNNGGTPSLTPGMVTETHVPVCLVDNGMFSAAGVAYSEAEKNEFAREDGRAKLWYHVEREKVREVSDLANWE